MRIKKRIFYLLSVLTLIIFLLITSCNRNNEQSSSSTSSSTTEYTVKKTNITDTVTVSGTIETESSAEVMALVSGVVKKVYVKEGDTVKTGDLLAELDDTDYQLAYVEALQNYELSRYSGSKLTIQQLQLKLDVAKRNLERCKITSPLSGVVTEMNFEPNDYVSTANVVAKVVNLSNLYISASVEEIDYSKIKVGQMAMVTFDAFEDSTFPAKVTYVGNEAQTTSGIVTIPIKLSLVTSASGFSKTEQLASKIIPGLSCEADIVILNKQNVIVVPTSAVSYDKGKAYVTVKSGETTEKRQVTLGEKFSSGYEVLDGLKEGEVIVISKTSSSSSSSSRSSGFLGNMIPVGGPDRVPGM